MRVVERRAAIKKLGDAKRQKDGGGASGDGGEMVVNIEWGAFGDTCPSVLPTTPMDDAIDAGSLNPGVQRFEKMISGFYLGEITRLCLAKLVAAG